MKAQQPIGDAALTRDPFKVQSGVSPGGELTWRIHRIIGSTPATNVDNSNALIPDPRNANRGMVTQFCTFMVVMHGHVKIK